MLSPKILKSQIHFFTGGGGGGWGRGVGSQLLMLSLKLLKSKIHIFAGGCWSEGAGGWCPSFDAESKFAKT